MIYDDAETWVRAFIELPAERLDELLCRYDQVAPYYATEPSDALVRIIRPRNDPALSETVDAALAGWLEARLREPLPEEDERNGYLQDIIQALLAVIRLKARLAGEVLVERLDEATAWALAVSPPDIYDLRAHLWLALAHTQAHRGLLSFWYRLCDEVGRGELGERYLDVALLGLRCLPQTEDDIQPGREVLRGLARWARHLRERAGDEQHFRAEWRALAALYPTGSGVSPEEVAAVLEDHPRKPFVRWWAEEVGMDAAQLSSAQSLSSPQPVSSPPPFSSPPRKRGPTGGKDGAVDPRFRGDDGQKGGTASAPPAKEETFRLIKLADRDLAPQVATFAAQHERYADATGDTYSLTRAFHVLGNALLSRAPRLSLRLARAAVTHDRNHEHSWMLWAAALRRLGHADPAETVLWEATRHFASDAHVRCDLARLLAERGGDGVAEAEALYLDTIQRFPRNDVSRNALARLLADRGRGAEAEALYRDTLQRFPRDHVSRNALARLLADQGRVAEAEALYRDTLQRFPRDVVSRNALARLLAERGETGEAVGLYQRTRADFPKDPVCRLDLGLLLLDLGRVDEVPPILEELRAMRATEARTLNDHLTAVQAGKSRPHREVKPAPPQPLAAGDGAAFAGMSESARAMRAGFLLSGALERKGLILVTAEQRESLHAEARATLAELQRTNPYHPVVRLVAQRYGGAAVDPSTLPANDDSYALALERARVTRQSFADLLEDKSFERTMPVTALAWLLAGDADAQPAAAVLLRFLQNGPGEDAVPVIHDLHRRLGEIIGGRSLHRMSAMQFLEAWDEEWAGPAESLNAVLDLAVFALVAQEPPYAALAWEPAEAA